MPAEKLVDHQELVDQIRTALLRLSGEDLAMEWNALFPNYSVRYVGDSVFEWVENALPNCSVENKTMQQTDEARQECLASERRVNMNAHEDLLEHVKRQGNGSYATQICSRCRSFFSSPEGNIKTAKIVPVCQNCINPEQYVAMEEKLARIESVFVGLLREHMTSAELKIHSILTGTPATSQQKQVASKNTNRILDN